MRKDVCRYFQRGFCQYGDKCKYLHVTPQQPKSNPFGFGNQNGSNQQQKPNPFGFGNQSGSNQQQKPNPFGFGNQSGSNQQQKPNPFGGIQNSSARQNQSKPFENTWTSSTASPAAGASTRQPDNQSQALDHQCTDPEACKRIIVADFQEESPLWKLSCYGHFKYLPCDITGDISFEELRATAYDDAKRGLNLQSIVEKERNLLNSKLVEFQNLKNNPYAVRSNSVPANQNQFPGAKPNPFSNVAQNSAPSFITGFSQMGSQVQTMGFGTRPAVTSNNPFGQTNAFQNTAQTSNAFGSNNMASGFSGSQGPAKPFGSFHSSNVPGFGNGGITKPDSSPFSAPAMVPNFGSATNQSASDFKVPDFSEFKQAAMNTQAQNSVQKNVSVDASIWLKEKWIPGEIPEEAPPDEYCR